MNNVDVNVDILKSIFIMRHKLNVIYVMTAMTCCDI